MDVNAAEHALLGVDRVPLNRMDAGLPFLAEELDERAAIVPVRHERHESQVVRKRADHGNGALNVQSGATSPAIAKSIIAAVRSTITTASAAELRGGGPPRKCSTKARSSASSGSSPAMARSSTASSWISGERATFTCSA